MMPTPQTPWEETVDQAMLDCVGVFGEGVDAVGDGKVIYTHLDGSPFPLDGIFEAMTEEIDPDTGAVVLSHKPVLSVALSKLLTVPQAGDTAVIRGKGYRVIDTHFDGQGTVTLRLHES